MSAGHGHGHGLGQSQATSARRPLAVALTLTATFAVVEVVVGIWSGSLALLADAGHMVGDAGALLLALFVAYLSERPPDDSRTYGYRRAEVLGALVNGAALLVIASMIVREAVARLEEPPLLRAEGLIGTAVVGLVVNIVAAWVLQRGAKGNLNVRAALLHVIGDALGSVAAIIAGISVLVFDVRIADPIASLVIAALILVGGVRIVRETVQVLMEGVPTGVEIDAIRRCILETEGVAAVHDLHVWCLAPSHPMLSAHVVLEAGYHGVAVSRRVGARLRELHHLHHVTIQAEAPPAELVTLRRKGE